MLYVVCHELGHGLGLPHLDTNHNNFSLGTCLDYTTAYRKNMRPDETDFLNLEKVYGIVGSTNTNNNNRRLSGMKVVEGTSLNKLKDIQSKAIHDFPHQVRITKMVDFCSSRMIKRYM